LFIGNVQFNELRHSTGFANGFNIPLPRRSITIRHINKRARVGKGPGNGRTNA
jgi:hypothetical protein